MIALSVDTADVSGTARTTSSTVPAAPLDPDDGAQQSRVELHAQQLHVQQSRAELRAQRRHARRQQRLYVILGLSVLVVVLAVTVAVLDMIR